ncbi:glycyl-radical enzyme activating protein [Candidatus Epulonipiscium fishelsonii]|uniref:Glycyl-radical enzyme activating protein n=1 Tax=Candidatus Epulonipiscium fishelsonii TaxID=77094 RepID=A0ACC8XHA6_9FIRM|nr:glycyl-radical enzyme activating protein [Epulopiscium sp. SCG-B05WGA-EpuloA1]ONI42885.1 glycyl-radical enzyme activating protein [Epulopiscium sp. SCG-B11WGA-EpuloA1]
MEGIISNIQRFTIHDGPGVRTELFFKGCPLQCKWCGNPESLKTTIELGVYSKKCISKNKCGACIEVCPQTKALNFFRGNLISINKDFCEKCFACYEACPADAIKKWGETMTVDECMEIIRKDKGYYERSGGGVTVSGGEAMLQSEFIAILFKICKEEGIHTCFESAFQTRWENIERVIPYTDLFISDIKHMDPEIHKQFTGIDNKLILENLIKFSETDKELILRIPVIPDVNDNMQNMEETANFILNELHGKVRTLQLLSFMRLGEEKYKSLNLEYPMAAVKIKRVSFQKNVQKFAQYFNDRGIHCLVGTKEKE